MEATFRDSDLEAQALPHSVDPVLNASSSHAPDLHSPTLSRVSIHPQDEEGEHVAEAQQESTWKPWRPGEPYRTVPESKSTMEDWIKAMEASDDGMCKGWRDQIDTLIIFAGLFSATVTAFTVESYQWLNETPTDTLARLQLRALLNGTASQDPTTIERLAPAQFSVSSSSVWINALWFASLTLALAAVVISILCKQWLYEYQRYENFTTEDSFLTHGLRYRGLQAWRVPEIIASLPILLQTALVLFLFGVLALLWSLQNIVASITTVIVGLTFFFLAATTVLPVIQYVYPKFDTQCAYKSSQSWSFFFISAFWLFDFSMFTNWASFDRWEVTRIYPDTGRTLSRVYELLKNNVDVFLGIYRFLADSSLNPSIEADLNMLSDFVDGLNASRRDIIISPFSPASQLDHSTSANTPLRRVGQLKHIDEYYHKVGKLRPDVTVAVDSSASSFSKPDTPTPAYHARIQKTFNQFLRHNNHVSDPAIFNRYVEHWAQSFDGVGGNSDEEQWWETMWPFSMATKWDPDVASYIVNMQSHLLKADQFSSDAVYSFSSAYVGLVESHNRHGYEPPPFILLKEIQDWISRMPESDLPTKVGNATPVLIGLVLVGRIFDDRPQPQASDLELQYLASCARFLVDFFERQEVLDQHSISPRLLGSALLVLQNYLYRHPSAPS